MKEFTLFLVSGVILLFLFIIINDLVFKFLKRDNKFRKFWERHICEDISWNDEDDPPTFV